MIAIIIALWLSVIVSFVFPPFLLVSIPSIIGFVLVMRRRVKRDRQWREMQQRQAVANYFGGVR